MLAAQAKLNPWKKVDTHIYNNYLCVLDGIFIFNHNSIIYTKSAHSIVKFKTATTAQISLSSKCDSTQTATRILSPPTWKGEIQTFVTIYIVEVCF